MAAGNGGVTPKVHISYGERASEMVVMWASVLEADNSSFVLFGREPGQYTHRQSATNWNFTAADANPDGLQFLHRAVLTVPLLLLLLRSHAHTSVHVAA